MGGGVIASDEWLPPEVALLLKRAHIEADLARDLARLGGIEESVERASSLLDIIGVEIAEAASHPALSAATARRLLRLRDTVDAHLLAASSLHELAMADDASRLLTRAADAVRASLDDRQDVAAG